jgi:HD-like signal output (HDOD) protein/FixJ family two-component response regulator
MDQRKNRILIVEDNETLRQLLVTTFERSCECEALAVGDGVDAVAVARAEGPDLVLLDLRLPGIDGIEVCRRLRGNPSTRSIPILVFTALGDRQSVLAGLRAGASDYVIKGAISSKELVARASNLIMRARNAPPLAAEKDTANAAPPNATRRETRAINGNSPEPQAATPPKLLSRAELVQRISQVTELKAMPYAVTELTAISSSPNVDIKDVVNVIERDPAIATQVLKLSNAAIYGAGQRIYALDRAVAVIGMRSIRELVMGLAVIEAFKEETGAFGREQMLLSEHSFGTAVMARALATKSAKTDPEKAFLGGLLHDVGKSMLFQFCGKEYSRVVQYAAASGLPLEDLEKQMLGMSHCEVASLVLNKWMMPPEISLPPSLHHQPWEVIKRRTPAQGDSIACVAVADRLAQACHFGFGGDDRVTEPERDMLEALGLCAFDANALYHEVSAQYRHLRTTMLLHTNPQVARKFDDPYNEGAHPGICVAIVDNKPAIVNPVEFYLIHGGAKVRYLRAAELHRQPAGEQDLLILRARTESAMRAMWDEIARSPCRPPAAKVLALVNGDVDISFLPADSGIECLRLPCRLKLLEERIPGPHAAARREE